MTKTLEYEDQIRNCLRQLDNPLLDKGATRTQLLKLCARYAEEAVPFTWDQAALSEYAVELREGRRLWAVASWPDIMNTHIEILYFGTTTIFYRDDDGEGLVTIGQVDPKTVRYSAAFEVLEEV